MKERQYIEMKKELEELCMLSFGMEHIGDSYYQGFWNHLLEKYPEQDIINFLAERIPSQTGIYKLVKDYFDPQKVILDDKLKGENKSYISRDGVIELDPDMSFERRMFSLFHELLHFHPDYFIYTFTIFNCTKGIKNIIHYAPYRREEVELMISADAQKTIRDRPLLVKYIAKKLGWKNED